MNVGANPPAPDGAPARPDPFAAGDALLSPVIADAMPSLVFVAAPGGKNLFVNKTYTSFTGRAAHTLHGDAWQDIIHPEDLPHILKRFETGAVAGGAFTHEVRLRGADGHYRWFLIRVTPLSDEGGRTVQYLGNATDIHALKTTEAELATALAEKDVLLHEVSHRVKNSLQLVTSLLSLQAAQTTDTGARRSVIEARNRIAVVAGVHQRLYWTNDDDCIDLAEYIRVLVDEVRTSPDCPPGLTVMIDTPLPVRVRVTSAVPLSLIVSELVGNACKYAFEGRPAGRLAVSVHANGKLVITVSDDGVGLPLGFDPRASRGLGMRIVTALSRQAKAVLTLVPQDRGAGFRIEAAI